MNFTSSPRAKSVQHLQSIKVHDEWETPIELLHQASREYSIWPRLDVCATEQNKKCGLWIDIEHDALTTEWRHDFFMNPPYSDIKRWMQKAYCQHLRQKVNGLVLTYAKTDTHWWHDYVEDKAEVHFIKGRIKFLINGQQSKNSAPYPSCWVIWRT